MMLPDLCWSIVAPKALTSRNGATKLISRTRRYCAAGSFSAGATRLMPASFTSTFVRPHRSLTAAAILSTTTSSEIPPQHFAHVCRRNARHLKFPPVNAGPNRVTSELPVIRPKSSLIFALSRQRISLRDELFCKKFLCRCNFRTIRVGILP